MTTRTPQLDTLMTRLLDCDFSTDSGIATARSLIRSALERQDTTATFRCISTLVQVDKQTDHSITIGAILQQSPLTKGTLL